MFGLKVFLISILLNFVFTQDENYFDVHNLVGIPWKTRLHKIKENREVRKLNLTTQNHEKLESEYGEIVIPNDVHLRKIETIPKNITKRKILRRRTPKIDGGNSRNFDDFLKKYLHKLYEKKYRNTSRYDTELDDISGEKSKIFGTGLETLAIIKNKTKKLANKFLNVFQIVKFNNTACTGNLDGLQYSGTCYLPTQCANLGGTPAGNCADGYGVCCIFRYSCGGSSSQNCSYFESPNYPNYYPDDGGILPPPTPSPTPDLRPDPRQGLNTLDCSFRISKTSPNIQQMRIDFLDLELLSPTNGTCVNERLVITGNGLTNQVPPICGYNTGQHVYVDVSMLNGPLMLSVLSNMAYRKRFRIRICQLSQMNCMTPNNCLQYYTGVTGVITSFNYEQASMLSRSTPSYFNNLNYAICIRREAGYCSVTYTNVNNGLEYPFQLANFASNGQQTVSPGQAGIESFDCPDDFIVINGVRLCGYKLNDGSTNRDLTQNAPVTDNSLGPIVIQVRTNTANVGRGFKLFYTQNRCPNT